MCEGIGSSFKAAAVCQSISGWLGKAEIPAQLCESTDNDGVSSEAAWWLGAP